MSRFNIPFAIMFVVLSGCIPTAPVNENAEGDVARHPPKQPVVAPQRPLLSGWGYSGTVQAVGASWILLAPGWTGTKVDGVQQWRDEDAKIAKRFSVVDASLLQAPTDPTSPISRPTGETHFVQDVQVGDRVVLMTGTNANGTQLLTEIKILRRPAGKIPPLHGDRALGTPFATHAREQAEQDWEEKGLPISKMYLNPEGRAPWTNPPYPPVAPEPHPAKGKP